LGEDIKLSVRVFKRSVLHKICSSHLFVQSKLQIWSYQANARVNSWSNHPPPGTPPKICLIDSSRGSGICISSFHVRAQGLGIVIAAKDPGDLTNGCPESHPQILRQQNLVSGMQGQGGVKFIVRIGENYNVQI
jgi:hypothetical protein